MKLWLVTVLEGFYGGYDTYDSFVVAAPDEAAARAVLDGYSGPEWRDPQKVSCAELTAAQYTEPTVVVSSFNAG